MKAEELMIGDWVMYKDAPVRIAEISKRSIQTNISNGFWNGFPCEDYEEIPLPQIEPIPLTKEILEKNGFYFGYTSNEEDMAHNTIAQLSQEDKGWVWDEGAGEIKVIFPNESNGGLINIDDQSFNRHLVFVFTDVVYVHELQHLLRLADINIDIKL